MHKHTQLLKCPYFPEHMVPSWSADIDECSLFAEEICKRGHCENTLPGYECYCEKGFYYDSNLLECTGELRQQQTASGLSSKRCKSGLLIMRVNLLSAPADVNECHDESLCANGHCVNTEGSFLCNCNPQWIPDANKKKCVLATIIGGRAKLTLDRSTG